MTTEWIAAIASLILGSGGYVAYRKAKAEIPLIQVTAQSKIIEDLLKENSRLASMIQSFQTDMNLLKSQMQSVVDDLHEEKTLRREREHELEQQRFDMAKQKTEQDYMRRRITAFMKALRKAGINPDSVVVEDGPDGH